MATAFIVIVNFRTAGLAVECLASIEPQIGVLQGGRVIVVDNDSGDGSAALIGSAIVERNWQSWAEVVALPRNGFNDTTSAPFPVT